MRYRSDIDGLRALAVIAVVLLHGFPTVLQGGFVGVDVFFVISGYLITHHILLELQNQNFSFYKFYARRIRRIFPALILVLIFCLIFGWYYLLSIEYEELGLHVSAGAGFVENFIYWRNIDYFDTGSIQKPLLHLWSLGIEEQFYILWPCILWLAFRLKINVLVIILIFSIISFICNISSINYSSSAMYFLPQNRFWELGIGGFCAWLELSKIKISYTDDFKNSPKYLYFLLDKIYTLIEKYPNYLATIGFIFLTVSFVVINKSISFPGWWGLLPTLGVAAIIIAGNDASPNRYILSKSFLVKIGLVSYPFYLWHWPILTFAFIGDIEGYSRELRIGLIIISLLLSFITYYLIEKPIRKYSIRLWIVMTLCLLMFAVFVSGLIIYQYEGFPKREFSTRYQSVTDAYNDWAFPQNLKKNVTELGNNFWRNNDSPPEIAFIGDSHIEQFAPRIISNKRWQDQSVIFITDNGCPPIPNVIESKHSCEKLIPRITNILEQFPSIKKIVIGGCWNCYFILETQKIPDKNNFDYYVLENNLKYRFRSGEGATAALQSLKVFINKLSTHYTVYLLLDNPLGKMYDPRSLVGNRFKIVKASTESYYVALDPEQKVLNDVIKKIGLSSGALIINQIDELCPDEKCIRIDSMGNPIYKDNHHIRPFFAKKHAIYIDEILNFISKE